ncbi:AlpA family phage regulatory protein [Pseudomonas sp. Kh13]|uniref:helix-turn-helix transcriptional regulator n=1 Tax=Pseudomonas sp. Kh13 TaxID=2093744 RepID=UPI0015B6D446
MGNPRIEVPAPIADALVHPTPLCQALGISRATLDHWVQAGHFPPPIVIGQMRGSGKVSRVAFLRSEIDAWILARKAERDAAKKPRTENLPA